MRNTLIFLQAIFVCAFGASYVLAQSLESKTSAIYSSSSANMQRVESGFVADSVKSLILSPAELATRIAQAKQQLKSLPTSSSGGALVNVAALDMLKKQISILSFPKNQFLVKGADLVSNDQFGRAIQVHVLRANGVNTAITAVDSGTAQSLLPLSVKFPISKNGVNETAFYTSAHPAIVTADTASGGETYVRTMLQTASESLVNDGVNVGSDILDVAEHLCVVEHTDHLRFITEDHAKLFPEILSLYAFNQGETFKYSVSTAGAGGMIQMIPSTYAGIRRQHPHVALIPDFVTGMRDHANALKAMLLYINDTWDGLEKNEEVQQALSTGIATKPELLAAGYNSNPMRLSGYLKNGGSSWRKLIPAETQTYLSIYSEVDKALDVEADRRLLESQQKSAETESSAPQPARNVAMFSWLSNTLFSHVLFTPLP